MNEDYKKGYEYGYSDGINGIEYRCSTPSVPPMYDYGYSVGYEDGIYHERNEVKSYERKARNKSL